MSSGLSQLSFFVILHPDFLINLAGSGSDCGAKEQTKSGLWVLNIFPIVFLVPLQNRYF